MYLFMPLFLSGVIWAESLPGTNWKLRDEYKLRNDSHVPIAPRQQGFSAHYSGPEFELSLKAVPIADKEIAFRASQVEFESIKSLYENRGNPYKGQITDSIQCDVRYGPKLFQYKLERDLEVKALTAGASDRRLLGACAREQIGYWAGYFNFWDPSSKLLIEGRLYIKAKHPQPKSVGSLSKRLEEIMKRLLVKQG